MTNPNEAEIEIFWGSGSPFAWRALMAAEIKGIHYRSRQLQFSEKEHKAPDYLALNPRGEVPTLRHGAIVLTESLAIMAYLDRAFPDPPLFGRTPAGTGEIWRWISLVLYHVEQPANRLVDAVFSDHVSDREYEVRSAATALHQEFAAIDSELIDRSWLADDEVSAADLVAHSAIGFLLRIAARDVLDPLDLGFDGLAVRYPALTAWQERTTCITGYDKAYPPHWRSS